jgi:hypothetical protein
LRQVVAKQGGTLGSGKRGDVESGQAGPRETAQSRDQVDWVGQVRQR